MADKIDELARAAATLDQAAEAEKQIAKDSKESAEKQGMTAEQAKGLNQEQKDISKTAANVAEAVKTAAPQAAEGPQPPAGESRLKTAATRVGGGHGRLVPCVPSRLALLLAVVRHTK